jgi:Tfp pilus assembly protein PilF
MVNLARIELESGTPEDARRWVDRALGSQPDYPAARALAGVISLRTGALVRAIDELRAARELAPLDAQVLTNLGAALIRSGRYSEAREVLDAALRLDRIPEAMLNLALAEDRSGEPARATHHYRAFLAVAPHGSPTRTRVSERLAEIADAAAAAPAPNGDEPGSIHALRKGDTEEERR